MALRYLVVANRTLGGAPLSNAVASKVREGAQIHIIAPTGDPHDAAPSGPTATDSAQQRLDRELAQFRESGIEASGEVVAANPLDAIRQALQRGHYNGLIISTLPPGASRWLHMDLPHRAVREFLLPVEWVEARDDDDEPQVVHVLVPPVPGPRVSVDIVRPSGGRRTPPL